MGAQPQALPPGVSVVVPVYFAEGRLGRLVERVEAVLDDARITYELVLVDDGSSDGTWAEVQGLAAARPHLHGLRLSRNCGQHNALLAGVRAAHYDRVVTLDDDLQHRPESIPALLEVLDTGADLVYGRADEPKHGWIRSLATRVSKWMLTVMTGEPMVTRISPLRAFRTRLRDAFSAFDGPYVSLDALLLWSTGRVSEMTVEHHARMEGESGYSLGKLARHALNVMVGFSSRPLRAASLLGFACTALGVVLLAFVLIRYAIDGRSVPGFAFLASAISIFSGAQLFAIGIIGEYLARIYPRVIGQPTYSIADQTGESEPDSTSPGDQEQRPPRG
jgi:glycosyltransferase involved in cell wall biosynthesis